MNAVGKQVLATEKFDAISKTLFEVALAQMKIGRAHV